MLVTLKDLKHCNKVTWNVFINTAVYLGVFSYRFFSTLDEKHYSSLKNGHERYEPKLWFVMYSYELYKVFANSILRWTDQYWLVPFCLRQVFRLSLDFYTIL